MRFNKCLSTAALLLLLPLGASASVSSMSAETSVQGDDGITYTQSNVNCRSSSEPRTIVRKEGEREWCAKEVEGMCSRQKIKVAKQVCSRRYTTLLEQAGSAQ